MEFFSFFFFFSDFCQSLFYAEKLPFPFVFEIIPMCSKIENRSVLKQLRQVGIEKVKNTEYLDDYGYDLP